MTVSQESQDGSQESSGEGLSGIDLTDDEYEVVQSLVRNKYEAYDSDGELVFKGKQKMLKLKEEFPFVDPDGEPLFTVSAKGVFDVAGDYTLVDERTDEPVVALDRNYSIMTDVWKIRDPKTEALLATIETRSTAIEVIRRFVPLAGYIPHAYDVTDVDGNEIGSIEGQLSLKDRYDITIEDVDGVPRDAVVAAAMVVDAIEGN